MSLPNQPNQPTRTMVLIAEDDDLLRDLVSQSLRAKGYTVTEAPCGDLAVSKLDETPVDILVTDIGLPGLDGWTLAGAARQRDPEVVVIYMSSKPNNPAKQVRPSVYLQKPFHPETLIDAIRQLTTNRLEGIEVGNAPSLDTEIRPQFRDIRVGEQLLRGPGGEDASGVDEGGE